MSALSARRSPLLSPGRARVERSGSCWLSLLELLGALSDGGLAVGGLLLVNHALARRLVKLDGSSAHSQGRLVDVARVSGLAELAHGGLQLRLHSLVALPCLLVLLVALDLGLDVCHASASLESR